MSEGSDAGPPIGVRRALMAEEIDLVGRGDDFVAPYQLDGWPVRGRIVRLGGAIDAVLSGHAYAPPVARLLGETLLLATLVGASLKFEGRLLVQARGEGPVSLIVADYDLAGALRGYAKVDEAALAALLAERPHPTAEELLGSGHLAMTIDRGPDYDRYQSLVALEGQSVADAASAYFESSEQVPTRLALAVGQVQVGDAPASWRGGGAIVQRVAGDAARGDTDDAWVTAAALFETISADELLDPEIAAAALLYRLFHETGVRVFDATPVLAQCRCGPERVLAMLAQFPDAEIIELAEADGSVAVTCEYCGRAYHLGRDAIAAARPR